MTNYKDGRTYLGSYAKAATRAANENVKLAKAALEAATEVQRALETALLAGSDQTLINLEKLAKRATVIAHRVGESAYKVHSPIYELARDAINARDREAKLELERQTARAEEDAILAKAREIENRRSGERGV